MSRFSRLAGGMLHRLGLGARLAPLAARDHNPLRSRARQALTDYYDATTDVYGWVPIPHSDLRCFGNLNDEFLRPLLLHGTLAEAEEVRTFAGLLQPGNVVFDVGANYGLFSLQLLTRRNDLGAIHLFEPNPTIARCLTRTRGAASSLIVHATAVGDRTGETTFFAPVTTASAHGSLQRHAWGESHGVFTADSGVRVEVRTIDDLVEALGIEHLGGVKIDVEGTEAEVISGMRQTLSRSRPRVVMCETSVGSAAFAELAQYYNHVFSVAGELHPSFWGNIFFCQPR